MPRGIGLLTLRTGSRRPHYLMQGINTFVKTTFTLLAFSTGNIFHVFKKFFHNDVKWNRRLQSSDCTVENAKFWDGKETSAKKAKTTQCNPHNYFQIFFTALQKLSLKWTLKFSTFATKSFAQSRSFWKTLSMLTNAALLPNDCQDEGETLEDFPVFSVARLANWVHKAVHGSKKVDDP